MEKLTLRGPDGTAYIKSSVTRHEAADRLAAIEEILGPDYDLDRLRALMEADRDGLVRIARRPPLESECCGNCAHFQRITGTGRGDCAVREYIKYNRGARDAGAREIHAQPVPEGLPAISKEAGRCRRRKNCWRSSSGCWWRWAGGTAPTWRRRQRRGGPGPRRE